MLGIILIHKDTSELIPISSVISCLNYLCIKNIFLDKAQTGPGPWLRAAPS